MPDSALILSSAQYTDIGGHATNQDAFAGADVDNLACFVVCDGVGGSDGGAIAATLVARAVIDSFCADSVFNGRALQSYIAAAAAQLDARKAGETGLQDMATTVALLLIDQSNRMALWAHVGDTRVYLFRGRKLEAVTKDHSVVQQLIDAGYCNDNDLRTHPKRSLLCAAIGAHDEAQAEVTTVATALQNGDAFLLCTDGFWEWISEAEMEHAAHCSSSPAQWLQLMRATVDSRNSGALKCDNHTAVAIYIGDPVPTDSMHVACRVAASGAI